MTIIIDKQEDDQRQLIVTVDLPESEVAQRLRETARRLSRDVRIPGFRPGKAPYGVMVQRLGETTLRLETLEHMLDGLFEQVMDELEQPPYLPATVEKMNLDPMQVVFAVPMEPVVTLGDYRSLRRTLEPVVIAEEAVDAALEQVRQRHQVVEKVERPADFEDLITVRGQGTFLDEEGNEGETYFEEESVDLLLDNNQLVFGPEFVTHVVGMSAGERKVFDAELPEPDDLEADAETAEEPDDAAASEADADAEAATPPAPRVRFDITVLEVKRRELPDLDDDLAQSEGDYETLEALRDAIRQELLTQAEQNIRGDRLEAMIDDLEADATVVYPPQAVSHEIDHVLEEFQEQVKRAGMKWDDYLQQTGEDEDALRERFRDSAVRRLVRGLLMRQFIKQEWLSVNDKDLAARIESRLEGVNPELHDYLQGYFLQGRGRESMANEIILDKVYERVVAILTGDAPDLAELEAAAMAATEEEE